MKTAKDLAFKAFYDGVHLKRKNSLKERFENWWSEWYYKQEHNDCFDSKLSVFIDGKRYIQAD